jgi:4-diphosphocytidyl-2-C-methyl-D-erythritol kinase
LRPAANSILNTAPGDEGVEAKVVASFFQKRRPPLSVSEYAWAKVNLHLHVLGRRPDGYHMLDSLVVFAGAADRLHAAADDGVSLAFCGPFGGVLAAEADNLVLRAARALDPARGARMTLEKHLPVASGIGGGSADAAAALRLLARVWGCTRAPAALALSLGADVPACLASVPCRMSGIGDVLAPAPALPAFGIALVNPGVAVATADVFRALAGAYSAPAALPDRWAHAAAMATDLAALRNDLETPAIALCPAIADVLAALRATPGCLLARMSGSGATCFALYETADVAAAGAAACARPGWWHWGGGPAPIPD